MMAAYGGVMTTKKSDPTPIPDRETAEKLHEELHTATSGIHVHGDDSTEIVGGAAAFVPSIGRIVHYQSGEDVVAALVTAVSSEEEGTVSLTLFHPHGQKAKPSVKFSEKPEAGCWNAPPRV